MGAVAPHCPQHRRKKLRDRNNRLRHRSGGLSHGCSGGPNRWRDKGRYHSCGGDGSCNDIHEIKVAEEQRHFDGRDDHVFKNTLGHGVNVMVSQTLRLGGPTCVTPDIVGNRVSRDGPWTDDRASWPRNPTAAKWSTPHWQRSRTGEGPA